MNIGIIGCGARVRDLIGKLLERNDDVRIVALCDPSAASIDKAQALIGGAAKVHDDHQSLVTDEAVSWVMVGSPNVMHRDHAIAALDAGRDVFCEKPLATTLDDCLAIRAAAQRAGRRLIIGFTLRFSPFYRTVRQLLDEGIIGELISFEFNETLDFNHGGYIHQDWRRHTASAGTHLLEKCCHDIDLANWFVGARAARVASFGGLRFFTPANRRHVNRIGPDPKTGRPAYGSWGSTSDVDPFTLDKDIVDHQVAIIEYANGVCATFHTNCQAALAERRFYMLGSEGSLRGNVYTGELAYARVGWDQKPIRVDPRAAGGHGGGDEVLVDDWAAAMRSGAAIRPGVDEGLASAATCFAIDQAMTDGCVVDLADIWRQVDATAIGVA